MATVDDNETMELKSLPTLYKRNENGSVQEWTIRVGTDTSGNGWMITDFGKRGGKVQRSEEVITEGKNLGKVNETTPVEQAMAEAAAKWEGKLKKGYVKTLEDAEAGKTDAIIAGGVSPMLAHKYHEQGHKIAWPAFVQPKLDGHRCIVILQDGKATMWSRTRKRITGLPHIARAVESQFAGQNIVLDGELYNHDYRHNFEDLTGFIRSATPKPGSEVVQYWIYDVVNDSAQDARVDELNRHMLTVPLVALPTEVAADEGQMIAIFGAYTGQEFEGLMVRNFRAKYKNARSYDLQKVKTFIDAEFEIVDVVPGKGKMGDKGVFVVKTDEGKEFKAKMVGALDDLRKYLDNKDAYIGKMLTVKYQKLSAENIPVFGVAMRLREDV